MGKGARRVPECYVRGHRPPYPYRVAVDAVYNRARLQQRMHCNCTHFDIIRHECYKSRYLRSARFE